MEDINKPHTSIKNWSVDDRPREKMMLLGSEALSRSELLAIIINNGSKQKSALDLAREVMVLSNNSLHQLARLQLDDLQKIKGIGIAKAVAVKAAMELALRKQAENFVPNTIIRSAEDVLPYLHSKIADKGHELFIVVFLSQSNKIIESSIISQGGISGTVVDVRMILKKAIDISASSLILSHNHPSGNLQPSKADLNLTQKIKNAAEYFDIKVLDHVIVSQEGHYSFANEGQL